MAQQNLNLELSVNAEMAEFPFDTEAEFLICGKLKAPQFQSTNRAPMDLVCSIDRSGSMSGEKLALVKETLEHVVAALGESDRLGIVVYDHQVQTILPLTKMTAPQKEDALGRIRRIEVGGNTNLSGGLLEGVNLLRKQKDRQQVASVLLFTDGLANEGLRNVNDIIRALTDQAFANSASTGSRRSSLQVVSEGIKQLSVSSQSSQHVPLPCTVNTFGFGSDHDSNMLTKIAQSAGGMYYFIENTQAISEAFADCLGGLLSVVASDIEVKFTAENGTKLSQILTKWAVTVVQPEREMKLKLRDMQSEENRHFLVKVVLPRLGAPVGPTPMAKMSVEYTNAVTSQKVSASSVCLISRPARLSPGIKRDVAIDIQYNRYISAKATEEATDAADKGDFAKAQQILTDAINQISQSASASDPLSIGFVTELRASLATLSSRQEYRSVGEKKMKSSAMAHYSERSSDFKSSSQVAYQTQSRSIQREAFSKK